MTEALQTDDDYLISGAVDDDMVPDEAPASGAVETETTAETELIKEIRDYCKKAIGEHNSFDVLNLPQNATPEEKCAVFDEMFNHKGLVHHLRQIQSIIDNKVKEN